MEKPISSEVPFSLVCERCDAGMDIGSYEEAEAQGWHFVQYAPDLPMANYVGLCPTCRRAEEEESIVESEEA
jgi:hypothetical protein